MKIAIKEITTVKIGNIEQVATQLEMNKLIVAVNGSEASMQYSLSDANNNPIINDTLIFTAEEVKGFNGIDFSNSGLINYVLQKLGLEKV